MALRHDLSLLKRGLKTEIQRALAGEHRQSIVLLVRDDRLPMARITDEQGVVTNKVMSVVDLISALDGATTISQLRRDQTRRTDLPILPSGALLMSMTEQPEGRSFTVTGYVEPATYVFLVEENGTKRTFDIPLPHLVYRAVYDERRSALSGLSVAMCSPKLSAGAPPKGSAAPRACTEIFRYPFSNVHHSPTGASGAVCWHGLGQIQMSLDEIPEKALKGFVRTENNADIYGRGLSHNAPQSGYCEFLAAIEQQGGLYEDHLIPTNATIEDLHYQRRA